MMVPGFRSMAVTMVTADAVMGSFYKMDWIPLQQGFVLESFHVPK